MKLNTEQEQEIKTYLNDFRQSSMVRDNDEDITYQSFDEKRVGAIPEIEEIVKDFLDGSMSVTDFKEKSDSLSRKYPYWGFGGFSGQMQLNQYAKNIENPQKEQRLREALVLPKDLNEAVAKINNLAEYLSELKTTAENPKSIPRVNQSFMLSYFWEMQSPEAFPVFYGSAKNVLEAMGFDFKTQETIGDEYRYFADIYNEIRTLFETKESINEQYPIWYVEHVLWKQFNKQHESEGDVKIIETPLKIELAKKSDEESWIPPIVADLEKLALNQETEWSKKRGQKPEKAFETKLRYVFTILGFNTTELGQGKGREPDGVAISTDGHSGYYAVVYDAKAREKEYVIGTGDREIVEYIKNKQRELQRQRVDKISFLIVSSEFTDRSSLDSSLKDIYRATRVPVVLVRAKDLLYIVGKKLSNADIDHTQLEDLFLDTGILTIDKIVDVLG